MAKKKILDIQIGKFSLKDVLIGAGIIGGMIGMSAGTDCLKNLEAAKKAPYEAKMSFEATDESTVASGMKAFVNYGGVDATSHCDGVYIKYDLPEMANDEKIDNRVAGICCGNNISNVHLHISDIIKSGGSVTIDNITIKKKYDLTAQEVVEAKLVELKRNYEKSQNKVQDNGRGSENLMLEF